MYAACQYIQKLGKPLSTGCAWNRICAWLCSVLGAPAGQEQPRIVNLSPWALSLQNEQQTGRALGKELQEAWTLYACFLTSACVHAVAQSCPTLCDPWTVAHQVPLYMGFSRQEYWSGLPFSPPRDLPDPCRDRTWVPCTASSFFITWATREALDLDARWVLSSNTFCGNDVL